MTEVFSLDKGLTSTMYKKLKLLNTKKTNSLIKKMGKEFKLGISQNKTNGQQIYLKSSTSPIIREMQIKATMSMLFTLFRWL